MKRISFLSVESFKDLSIVESNVDPKLISITILDCQKINYEPILGTSLYTTILNEITDNNVSTQNKYLLNEFILPALIKRVEAQLPLKSYKYTNVSVLEKTSENTEAMTMDDKFKLMRYYDNLAENLEQRLIDHLCVNYILYPSYHLNNKLDMLKPNNDTTYNCGIVL